MNKQAAPRKGHLRTVLAPRQAGQKAKAAGSTWACKTSFTTGSGS